MKNINQDHFFSELLQNDRVGEPEKAIEDRLMYSFMLKNSRSKLKQNSFASFFGWIFSVQGLGLKTGLVSVVLFFSIMNNQLNFDSSKIVASDSIANHRILIADTIHLIQPIDSLRPDSLN
jgi:hypothetical protein